MSIDKLFKSTQENKKENKYGFLFLLAFFILSGVAIYFLITQYNKINEQEEIICELEKQITSSRDSVMSYESEIKLLKDTTLFNYEEDTSRILLAENIIETPEEIEEPVVEGKKSIVEKVVVDKKKSTEKKVVKKTVAKENETPAKKVQKITKTTLNSGEKWWEGERYYYTKIDLRKHKIDIHSASGGVNKINDIINDKLLFATNGGIFEGDFSPTGLLVVDGKKVHNINLKKGSGNFYLQPNGVFYISSANKAKILESNDFNKRKADVKHAIQSGPLLLLNGKINKKFSKGSVNKYVRSGVGILDDNTVIFAISKSPVCFYDFAEMFLKKLSCKNALYLDGAISEMYLPGVIKDNYSHNFSTIISVSHE